jgi:hypothetical protein
MENENFLNDDFLREMIGKSAPEIPSVDFVEKVMSRIQAQPEVAPSKTSLSGFLKSSLLYFILAAFLVGFFVTSDIPFMKWIPGKDYFVNTFLPYFSTIFTGLKWC